MQSHMKRMLVRMTVLNLVHEVLHSFGEECGVTRVTWQEGVHTNNQMISPCTARSVSTVLGTGAMTGCREARGTGHCRNGKEGRGEQVLLSGDVETDGVTNYQKTTNVSARSSTRTTFTVTSGAGSGRSGVHVKLLII